MYVDNRRWRTGRSLGRTVYAQHGTGAAKGDELLGLMETTDLADHVVELHNKALTAPRTETPVYFEGGPWNGKAVVVNKVVGPVYAPGLNPGRHYWLDIESDPPTYHWRPTD
jgi:hypothetical protein